VGNGFAAIFGNLQVAVMRRVEGREVSDFWGYMGLQFRTGSADGFDEAKQARGGERSEPGDDPLPGEDRCEFAADGEVWQRGVWAGDDASNHVW
jgi:hypothetical protein